MKKQYFVYILITAIVLGLGYSLFVYLKTGVREEGLVFCEAGKCFLAPGDIHAEIEIKVCGKSLNLPLDRGSTDGPHTHKKRNLIHFEGKLGVDTQTKEVINKTPLMLKTFFDVVGIRFAEECIADKCNGDLCNGKPGTLKVWINNEINNQFQNYVWKDDDNILIKFE